MQQMQWAHGRGPHARYAGKLSADVDAGPSVSGLREYCGPCDPLSPHDSACSESPTARITFGEGRRPPGQSGLGLIVQSQRMGGWGFQQVFGDVLQEPDRLH